MTKRIPKPARVTGPPSGRITTADAMNLANTDFWKQAAAIQAQTEAMVSQGIAVRTKVKASKAGKARVAKRKSKNIDRDRRIHDLRAEGKKLKEIAGALRITNHSVVSRVLRKPRP